MNNNFESISYEKHNKYFENYASGSEQHTHAQSWLNKNSVDHWRHERFFSVLSPLISNLPQAEWLTVGDGRYGKDAQWLQEKGCKVMASDISGVLLEEAYSQGLLNAYSIENAESLSFDDNQFDIVLCKESYHHFPRPMVALYELLRVAKTGVILIEPGDHQIAGYPMDKLSHWIVTLLDKLRGKDNHNTREYEDLGNYVYRISKREIEKVALGLNYPCIAFKGLNDFYHKDMIHENISENGKWYKRARWVISTLDILSRYKIRNYRTLTAILFKTDISDALTTSLIEDGYDVIHLGRNPYI